MIDLDLYELNQHHSNWLIILKILSKYPVLKRQTDLTKSL